MFGCSLSANILRRMKCELEVQVHNFHVVAVTWCNMASFSLQVFRTDIRYVHCLQASLSLCILNPCCFTQKDEPKQIHFA